MLGFISTSTICQLYNFHVQCSNDNNVLPQTIISNGNEVTLESHIFLGNNFPILGVYDYFFWKLT
jgi:hypothetical protein